MFGSKVFKSSLSLQQTRFSPTEYSHTKCIVVFRPVYLFYRGKVLFLFRSPSPEPRKPARKEESDEEEVKDSQLSSGEEKEEDDLASEDRVRISFAIENCL